MFAIKLLLTVKQVFIQMYIMFVLLALNHLKVGSMSICCMYYIYSLPTFTGAIVSVFVIGRSDPHRSVEI